MPPADDSAEAVWRFDRYALHPTRQLLLADGAPIALGPRAIDLLRVLLERAGQLVSKQQLFDLVWPNLVVCDANLNVQVSNLRKAIGRDAIVTVPGRGYRFVGRLAATPAALAAETPREAICTTSLIGRDAELSALDRLLATHRLVTLVGAGGIGKTSLAQTIVQRHRQHEMPGACLADLALVSDETLLPRTVAEAAGAQLGPGEPVAALVAALAPREMLIVLDNAEHQVGVVARIAHALLEGAPGVRLLVTSQAMLRIASETVYRLPALALPLDTADAAMAASFGAVALFVERAQAVDRSFALNAANVATVIDICRRLDGLPLALELAATRIPALGLSQLATSLDHRFRVLTAGARTADPRHRTLRATLEWSHGLLSPVEQRVFQRLSVFTGSFPLAWARAVASDATIDEWTAVEALAELVDRSLVAVDTGEPPRYRLLESAHLFAGERLAASGEADAVRARHAHALRDWFEDAYETFFSGAVAIDAWRAAHALDVGDGRAALDWAFEHDATTAIALVPCLDWLMLNDPAPERLRTWDASTPLLDKVDDLKRKARWALGRTFIGLNLAPIVYAYIDGTQHNVIGLLREAGDRRGLYLALRWLLRAAMDRLSEGFVGFTWREILDQMRAAADPSWPAAVRYHGARGESEAARLNGDLDASIDWLRRAQTLAREAGDTKGEYSAQVALQDTEVMAERYTDAYDNARSLDAVLRDTPYEALHGHTRINLLAACIGLGRLDEAHAIANASWAHARRFGVFAFWSPHLALLAACDGRLNDAARLTGYVRKHMQLDSADNAFSIEARALVWAEAQARAGLGETLFARLASAGSMLGEDELRSIALRNDGSPVTR